MYSKPDGPALEFKPEGAGTSYAGGDNHRFLNQLGLKSPKG